MKRFLSLQLCILMLTAMLPVSAWAEGSAGEEEEIAVTETEASVPAAAPEPEPEKDPAPAPEPEKDPEPAAEPAQKTEQPAPEPDETAVLAGEEGDPAASPLMDEADVPASEPEAEPAPEPEEPAAEPKLEPEPDADETVDTPETQAPSPESLLCPWQGLSDEAFIAYIFAPENAAYLTALLSDTASEEYAAFTARLNAIEDGEARAAVNAYLLTLVPAEEAPEQPAEDEPAEIPAEEPAEVPVENEPEPEEPAEVPVENEPEPEEPAEPEPAETPEQKEPEPYIAVSGVRSVTVKDDAAVLTAKAYGTAGHFTYQWEQLDDGIEYSSHLARREAWAEIPGETGATLTFTGIDADTYAASYAAMLYRCIVRTVDDAEISDEARLLPDPAWAEEEQPAAELPEAPAEEAPAEGPEAAEPKETAEIPAPLSAETENTEEKTEDLQEPENTAAPEAASAPASPETQPEEPEDTDEPEEKGPGKSLFSTVLASGTCGENLTWVLDNDGVLTISGTGDMTDYSYNNAPWVSSRDSITSVIIGNGVTSIGSYAFSGCSSLTSVTIPVGVTSIGNSAFNYCSGLTSVTVPASVTSIDSYAFNYCSSLTSVTIPAGVTSIGSSAFSGCSRLKTAGPIGGDYDYQFGWTNSIPENAFSRCSSLTSVNIPAGVTSIGSYAFYNCSSLTSVTIPAGVTRIGQYAFYYCSGLTTLTIPDSMTHISLEAFQGCSSLQVVYITDLATWCGIAFESSTANPLLYAHALYLNSNLVTDLTIPAGVTRIRALAFYNCSDITTITIPNSVTDIDYNAFDFCSALTDVYYGGTQAQWDTLLNNTNTDNNSLRNATVHCALLASGTCGENLTWVLDNDGVLTISGTGYMTGYSSFIIAPWDAYKDSITSVVITDGITNIGWSAFYRCSNLTSVTIPNSVTDIGEHVFYECSNLTSVTIPNSVTSIGRYAFYGCSALTSITIPASVTSIGKNAFSWCCGLMSIDVSSENSIYKSEQNCIIRRSDNVLIQGCKYSTVPEGVTIIESAAFSGCSGLISVTIPNGVTSIGESAFRDCSGLTTITIPDSVTSIGESAFSYCFALVDVYYTGTQAQWTALLTNTGTDNDPLRNATVHYAPLASGTCGENLTWELSKGGVLTISGTGEMTDYWGENAPWYSLRSRITAAKIQEGVTGIGSFAFCNCTNLASVTVPGSVTSIGDYAFENCVKLDRITLSDGVESIGNYAFYGCSGLTSVTFPDSLTSIGSVAFSGCTGLTSVTFPDSLTSIGDRAFENCTGLTSVTVPEGVREIGSGAFSGCTGLDAISVAAENEYYRAEGNCLISAEDGRLIAACHNSTIPAGITCIGDGAFSGCTELTSVIIPEGVTKIGSDAFSGCTGLTSVIIPEGVTKIGNGAFSGCTGLTSVIIPESVTVIDHSAFYGCTGLTSVSLPAGLTRMGGNAFAYSGLKTVTLPACSELGSACFAYAPLTKAVLAEGTETLPYGIFAGCDKLTEIVLPDTLRGIGAYALAGCVSLNRVTIPAAVDSIGNDAFAGCTGLKTIVFTGDMPSFFNDTASYGVNMTAFWGVEANAFYPGNNRTYTSAAMLSYGGKITWIPSCAEHSPEEREGYAATCTEPGMKPGTVCSVCGMVLSGCEIIPAAGHTATEAEAHAATCTEPGHTAGTYCSVCGAAITGYTQLPALGHDYTVSYTWDDEGLTCTASAVCAHEQAHNVTKTVSVLNVVRTEPTCTEEGETFCLAIFNNALFTAQYKVEQNIPALGHDRVPHEAKAATCLEPGWAAYETCSRCDYTTKVEIPASGIHTPVTDAAVAPTYWTEGKTEGSHCKVCGTVITKQQTVPKTTMAAPRVRASGTKATVTWTKVPEATGYKVFVRKDNSTEISKTLTVKKGTTVKGTYSGITPGHIYSFTVMPVKGTLTGAESEAAVYTAKLATPKLKAKAKNDVITLTWGKIKGAAGYTLTITDPAGTVYTKELTAGAKKTTLKVAPTGKYTFNLVAHTAVMTSNASERSAAVKLGIPVVTVKSSKGLVTVSWKAMKTASTFVISRSESLTGPFEEIGTATSTKYTDRTAVKGMTYYYKVTALNTRTYEYGECPVTGGTSAARKIFVK